MERWRAESANIIFQTSDIRPSDDLRSYNDCFVFTVGFVKKTTLVLLRFLLLFFFPSLSRAFFLVLFLPVTFFLRSLLVGKATDVISTAGSSFPRTFSRASSSGPRRLQSFFFGTRKKIRKKAERGRTLREHEGKRSSRRTMEPRCTDDAFNFYGILQG